jgi:SAM-dependent methyltransferase
VGDVQVTAPSLAAVDAANKAVWDRVLRRDRPTYPDEQVVRFLAGRAGSGRPTGGRGLDVGFGSGRHLALLMEQGYQASGIEVLEEAVTAAAAQFAGAPRLGELVTADLRDRPFPDGHFRVAIAWGVVFVRPSEEMLTDLKALHAMLEPGGGLCVNFRTTDDWLVGRGEQVGPSSWVLDERAGPYAGAFYTFVTAGEAAALLDRAGFEVDDHQRVELWKHHASQRHTWWTFQATRRAGR